MTLRELEIFYYLCDNPHLSQLSKRIRLSQSAISLAIKSLERKLGEPLFDRIGKKLLLNERGRFFKERTHHHFLALKDAQNLFKQDKLSGILKVTSSKTVGNFIMPELIFSFMAQNPQITIHKDIRNSTQIIEMVAEGETDMGIIETECHRPDIVKEELRCDQLAVVTSDATLAERSWYIDQLFDRKWLLREKGSGTRELFLDSLGELAKELEVFMEFTDFEEMKSILQNHPETITCVSRFAVAKELERKELFEVKLKNLHFKRKLYLIYHQSKYQSTLFETFGRFLLAHV